MSIDPRPDPTNMSAPEYAHTLCDIGMNILVHDIAATVEFLDRVFNIKPIRIDDGAFAIIRAKNIDIMLHQDETYGDHAMINILPENPPRGAGIEIRLYEIDPDLAVSRAHDHEILVAPKSRPHGLREAFLIAPDGQIFVPSIRV